MRSLIQYIRETSNKSSQYNIMIAKFDTNDSTRVMTSIHDDIVNHNKNVRLDVDCGKLGTCIVMFNNDNNNVCELTIRMNNLSKLVKFDDKKIDSEYITKETKNDAYNKAINILRRIKKEL